MMTAGGAVSYPFDSRMLMQLRCRTVVSSVTTLLTLTAFVLPSRATDESTAKKYEQMVDRAIAYLGATAQSSDGSFSASQGPAVTALVGTAILRHGRSPADPVVVKALKYLEGFVREDGGIYAEGTFYKNYETCIAIMFFKEANRNGKYDKLLKNANDFIKSNQWGSAGEKGPQDVEFGGAGYGRSKRPDLSNTSFFVDALKAGGDDQNS